MKVVFPILALVWAASGEEHYEDLAAQQTVKYAERKGHPDTLTTANGSPVDDLDASVSVNRRILFNEFLVETLTHLNRQKIPERPVHAKGSGAFGYFEVTHDYSSICKAKFLSQVNKKTPIAVRFSSISANLGGMDTTRDGRGLAIKFYTEDGNFDLLTLNTPVFALKDPLVFPTFVNAQARNPATNLLDNNMLWDYITLRPESIFYFLLTFGDLGIPKGYRFMRTYSLHTYQVANATGHSSFVRFFLKSDQGTKYFTSAEGAAIGGKDPDYATKDLYNAIANGDYPSWTVYLQILSLEDVKEADFDVFDTTLVLPKEKYPLKPLGRFYLNRNAVNFFAEMEQIAMCPTNLVPGILGAPDKLFEARRLAYRDAQYYRLGANFHKIPVNCPFKSATYNVDGRNSRNTDSPIYYPNSYNGPVPYVDKNRAELIDLEQDYSLNFDQVAKYLKDLAEDSKERLVENIVDSLGTAEAKIQERALKWFRAINAGFGQKVEDGLMEYKTKNHTENPYPDHDTKFKSHLNHNLNLTFEV